jgi:hypothetical protein
MYIFTYLFEFVDEYLAADMCTLLLEEVPLLLLEALVGNSKANIFVNEAAFISQ